MANVEDDDTDRMVQIVSAASLQALVGALQPVVGNIIERGALVQSISHACDPYAEPEERWSALVVALHRDVR